MLEINQHECSSLYSIRGVNDDYTGRTLLRSKLRLCYRWCRNFYSVLGKKFYDDDKLVTSVLERLDGKTEYLKHGERDLAFIASDCIDSELFVDCLIDLWFEYQHVGFYVLSGKLQEQQANSVLKSSIYWKDFVGQYSSFVVFKGAQDDVVWIGKSRDIDWSILEMG